MTHLSVHKTSSPDHSSLQISVSVKPSFLQGFDKTKSLSATLYSMQASQDKIMIGRIQLSPPNYYLQAWHGTQEITIAAIHRPDKLEAIFRSNGSENVDLAAQTATLAGRRGSSLCCNLD